MGKKIRQLFASPIYTYLYGLSFLSFKSSAYIGNFVFLNAIAFLIVFFVLNLFLTRSLSFITRSEYAPLFTLVIWMAIFHVAEILHLFGYPYAYISWNFYLVFYTTILGLILLLGFMLREKAYPKNLSKAANVFVGMTILVFFLNGIKTCLYSSQETLRHQHQMMAKPLKEKRDIVWILMDELGSSETLQQQMGFQNPMDTLLSSRGFQLFEQARSRYGNTLFSVYSIFNVDDSLKPSSFYAGIDLLRKSSWVPALESAGYQFVNLGFFDIAGHPMLADRSGYPYSYLQQILSGTLLGMIQTKWKSTVTKCDAYNQLVLERLNDSLGRKNHQSRFIWAHITIPHEPFCRDSSGNVLKDETLTATDSVLIKQRYHSYLQYGIKRVIQLLDNHPDYKEKIVVISGDHGPRYPFLKDQKGQLTPYLAIHLPKEYPSLDPKSLIQISSLPSHFLQMQSK